MGQDEVWSSPVKVQRVALGIVSGAGVRAVGWTALAQNKCQWKAGEGAFLASCVGEAGPRLLSGHALFT